MSKLFKLIILSSLLLIVLSVSIQSRDAVDRLETRNTSALADDPAYGYVNHRIGKIVLAVGNDGTIGLFGNTPLDFFTNEPVKACEYPKNSRQKYLFAGGFWIGAVVNRDTLVSEGADGWSRTSNEFAPDPAPFGNMKYRSIRFPEEPQLFKDAVSEEDYIAVYTDNAFPELAANDNSGRPHIPLNIQVTQRSFAWSYPYAEDFVLFDYEIKNIGFETIRSAYMGLYIDADVGFPSGTNTQYHTDDICGFIETLPVKFNDCDFIDTVNIAWIADDDGDPKGLVFDNESVPHVTATRIIRTPADSLQVSFNWWVSNGNSSLDYGPRERGGKGKWKEPFREFVTGALGTPEGDADKYYQLRNQEFDFDQIYSASISATDSIWVAPEADLAIDIADGYDTRYLLSFGPFTIAPGEKLPISFAYIGGENLHKSGFDNSVNLPNDPRTYYNNLDFSDLGENAAWASKVYDNPGIDTDDSGFKGYLRRCCLDSAWGITLIDTADFLPDSLIIDTIWDYIYDLCDTLYYEGDGVPDFKGASPPPAPKLWVTPSLSQLNVRFNGLASETSTDVFSRLNDFEGYRVYIARDDRDGSFTAYTSYDINNYNKYVWDVKKQPIPGYVLKDVPFTYEALKELYFIPKFPGDTTFIPETFTRNSPYYVDGFPDSIFYFVKQDFNMSRLGIDTKIEKAYPLQPYPSNLNPDSAIASDLTEDGYLKYFEYKVAITGLLPTVPWYVNVTAFDFGSPQSGLPALETSKSNGAKYVYPLYSDEEIAAEGLKPYVWPNPYRIDGGYSDLGFEKALTDQESSANRIRRVNFANLPSKCTIKIFTIDGDLVRSIEHDFDESDPNKHHDVWDLITRNTQLAVSGLYYWTIEAEGEEIQIGKLVLLM